MCAMPPTAKRVLCVGNHEDICKLITMWLSLDGFEAATAGGAREALELVARASFDLIVIDDLSPAGTGLELCLALREWAPGTPILLYTIDPFEPSREQAAKAGARELLVHDGDAGKLTAAASRLTDCSSG